MRKIPYLFLIFILSISCISKKDTKESYDPRKTVINENIDRETLREKVREIFLYIENMIAKGNFEKWYESISNNYKKFLENPENLKQIVKNSEYLKNRNIELKNAKDFFLYVVKASREEGPLKFYDCEPAGKNRVKVICFDKEGKLIYNFVFEDNLWKIDR